MLNKYKINIKFHFNESKHEQSDGKGIHLGLLEGDGVDLADIGGELGPVPRKLCKTYH